MEQAAGGAVHLQAQVGLVVALLLVAVGLARAAERLHAPRAVALVLGGVALAGLRLAWPALPAPRLTPGLVFDLFLPPLLMSAAYDTPVSFLRANVRAVGLLALGLVVATMLAVAWAVRVAVPDLPLAAALALGAVLGPSDPVAAQEVGGRTGMPHRLEVIVQGEGLVNDATALTAFRLALAAMGGGLTLARAAGGFALVVAAGLAAGLLLGWLGRRALGAIDDPLLETSITLVLPYATYVAAEAAGGSGVLATVAAGFVLRHDVRRVMATAETRINARAVWSTLVFLLDALVFLLVGLEVGDIFAAGAPPRFLPAAALCCAAVILTRLAWMFTVPWALRRASRRPPMPWRDAAALGWSGMRGVVSLATALSLPALAGGRPFPHRSLLIAVTFAVILATLVGQGLTLPALLRALGLARPDAARREEARARAAAAAAALEALDAVAARHGLSGDARARLRRAAEGSPRRGAARDGRVEAARRDLLAVERAAVERLRDAGHIGVAVAQRLTDELNLREVRGVA